MVDDPIVLYIVLRQSLKLDEDQISHCSANAVQHIMLKYFTWQLVGAKAHQPSLFNDEHVKSTTKWLGSRSKKAIVSVNEEVWFQLKADFKLGHDLFCLKDIESDSVDTETTLVFWPLPYSQIPLCLK